MSIKITLKQEKPIITLKQEKPIITIKNNGSPGLKGDKGDSGVMQEFICGEINGIGGHRVVYLDNEYNLIKYASNTNLNSIKKIVGITTQASTYLNNQNVQTLGEITDTSFNFTDLDSPIYLGNDGLLTQNYPDGTCIILGFPLSLNKMYIKIQQLIILS